MSVNVIDHINTRRRRVMVLKRPDGSPVGAFTIANEECCDSGPMNGIVTGVKVYTMRLKIPSHLIKTAPATDFCTGDDADCGSSETGIVVRKLHLPPGTIIESTACIEPGVTDAPACAACAKVALSSSENYIVRQASWGQWTRASGLGGPAIVFECISPTAGAILQVNGVSIPRVSHQQTPDVWVFSDGSTTYTVTETAQTCQAFLASSLTLAPVLTLTVDDGFTTTICTFTYNLGQQPCQCLWAGSRTSINPPSCVTSPGILPGVTIFTTGDVGTAATTVRLSNVPTGAVFAGNCVVGDVDLGELTPFDGFSGHYKTIVTCLGTTYTYDLVI